MAAGEENSGKLVTEVRKKAREISLETNADYIINDGPPGIGCTTIASVTGTKLVLVVIEPSQSGLHDAKRLIELTRSFKIPVLAIINKYDISKDLTSEIETYLDSESIVLIGKIPFDESMVEALIQGKTITEYHPKTETSKIIKSIWNKIKNSVNEKG